MIFFRFITCSIFGLSLLACQSSSQSSSASQSMPAPSSQSASSSQSMPRSSSQSASGSRSMPTPSSQSAAGSQSMPADSQERASNGEQVFGSGTRDSSTGELGGDNRASKRVFGDSGGDYTLETLPNSVFGGGISSGDEKPMTSAERAKVLDERLRKGYETFDGFILSERERAQNESNAAGSAQPGADAGGAGANQPQTMQEPVANSPDAQGSPPSAAAERRERESFPTPEDIPSGRDDDVVARQLREAAMNEPDEDLREALWDEYRNYTGIDGGGGQ